MVWHVFNVGFFRRYGVLFHREHCEHEKIIACVACNAEHERFIQEMITG